MNFSKIDKYLIAFFSIILIISCWLIVSIKQSSEILPDRAAIGTISFVENNVKKRNSFNQNWFDTYKNDSFVIGDFIFTGDESTALLDFYNGNRIIVSKNSLVRINDSQNKLLLSVTNGNIEAKSTNGMNVSIEGKKEFVVANQSEFKLEHKENKINIEVYNGDLELETSSKKVKLNDGDNVKISEGNTVIEKSKLRIDIAYILDNKLILHWNSEFHESPFEVNISENSNFSNPKNISTVLENIELPWSGQQAFIKITTKDKKGEFYTSSTRHIFNQLSAGAEKEVIPEIPEEKKSTFSKIKDYFNKILDNNSKEKVIEKMVKKNKESSSKDEK
jgi:hypothetical protein